MVLLELIHDSFTCMSNRLMIVFLACLCSQNLIKESFNYYFISLLAIIYLFLLMINTESSLGVGKVGSKNDSVLGKNGPH